MSTFFVFDSEIRELRDRHVFIREGCDNEIHIIQFRSEFKEGAKPTKRKLRALKTLTRIKGRCDGSCYNRKNGVHFWYEDKKVLEEA